MQAEFDKVLGVLSTEVGYTGGHKKNPHYEEVCSHKTRHAETIKIDFDPKKITYGKLLDVFFNSSVRNPWLSSQ